MLVVTESKRTNTITIAQYDSDNNLCGSVDLDFDAAGWYRQLSAEIDHMEQFEQPEVIARFRHRAAVTALSRMGVEV
jgi:hypothetical protein